jgi:hypothetical protein
MAAGATPARLAVPLLKWFERDNADLVRGATARDRVGVANDIARLEAADAHPRSAPLVRPASHWRAQLH